MGPAETWRARDTLYDQAIEAIIRQGRGRALLLQRALSIGYGRAARLVHLMDGDGIVGNESSSQTRRLLTAGQWEHLRQAAAWRSV